MTEVAYENVPITTALLLAAGIGNRLRPLTNHMPKCLTKVNDITILERLVQSLCQHKFKRLMIVGGYLERKIHQFLDELNTDIAIDYISSPLYRTTNNLYSLWLARNKIRGPFLLIESDLVFDASLLENMLQTNKIALSPMQSWMNGTTVSVDNSGQVTAFQIGSSRLRPDLSYKTVNMYSLSLQSWDRVIERLEQYVFHGKVKEYYETVFAEMIADNSLSFQASFFDPERWYEIDTLEDLQAAEHMLRKVWISSVSHG